MIRWRWPVMGLLLAGVVLTPWVSAQQQWPNIGELMWQSIDRLSIRNGCFLRYDFSSHKFRCLDPILALSREPESLNLAVPNPATLFTGEPKYLAFAATGTTCAGLSTVLPSDTVLAETVLLTWLSSTGGSGSVVWSLDWCDTGPGAAACTPNGTADSTATTAVSGSGRTDTLFSIAPDWAVDTLVVVRLCRLGDAGADDHAGEARLTGVRLEFRQYPGSG